MNAFHLVPADCQNLQRPGWSPDFSSANPWSNRHRGPISAWIPP